MAKKGIEEMISEIEIFIDNCKYQPLSSSKIVVPKDDLEQMLPTFGLPIMAILGLSSSSSFLESSSK